MNNIKESIYKVYIHINKINNKKYVGITNQNVHRRWRKGKGYSNNKHFTNAINKYGWDNFEHNVLFECSNKENAEQLEIYIIKNMNLTNQKYGYNIQNGGGSIGKFSEETKLKMSLHHANYFGENNPNYGKHLNQEAKINISKAHKGIKQKQGTKDKRANALKKGILQFDKDMNFIKAWDSTKNASIALNIPSPNITLNLKMERKSAGGYIWKYIKQLSDGTTNG